MQDRSREFQATVQALRASVGGRQEERPKTQLFITANNINKGITECHNKLHQLQLLSQNKGMFGDRPVEIQELTSIIKEELGQLNLAVKKLQEHVKKENNRWSEHKKVHHNTIVTSLNKRLKSATEKFKKTLEQRTANLKAARQRRSEFSGKGFDGMGAGGMSDMPTLMSTQQAMQQHGDSAAGGPGNGNGGVMEPDEMDTEAELLEGLVLSSMIGPLGKEQFLQMDNFIWANADDAAAAGRAQGPWFQQGFEMTTAAQSASPVFFAQHANGPCAVLAAVQAHVIEHLQHTLGIDLFAATPQEADAAFTEAIVRCLWNESGRAELILADPDAQERGMSMSLDGDDDMQSPSREWFRTAQPLHYMVQSRELAVHLVQSHLPQFRAPGGLALLLYSAILTTGLEDVRAQAGGGLSSLIDEDACADQCLMNLLLTHEAHSSVSAYSLS
ncbi:uncharacterized protein MONBRDRAFT_37036 [Monosiga brevicollis MX1]|uniref:Deubiquitinating enzyme MINDY-3/4 conserved domain-containing protein n=1 Tax=Monosiga brevicollis TaxID=81824 RepID=A9UZ68_MONBE|nr:uncharacterized protein MONBRDRAFT_37036 [Monosiga brevicollis MX1]EDQ89314.1 predicted protein [Monosiga brevicollis MX1]|eukprot:XP_001745890.1 hypothetical protein [Monosiga brevicollis MX1]